MNKYLVTGATGFIGSNLVRSLVKRGHKVSIITRNKKLNWRLSDLTSDLEIYQSDLLSSKIDNVIRKAKPDFVFHLAAYGVMANELDLKRMVEVNINGTINLINALKKIDFKLLVNVGSAVEYGVKKKKIREDDVLEPINDYGATKAAATLICQKEGIKNSFPVVTLRPFTPFGYFEDRTRLIPSVILSALNNEPIKVSVPTSVRDFIFIEDIIDAFRLVTKKKIKFGDIINIGSGKQHSVGDVVKEVIKLSDTKSKVEWGAVRTQTRFIEPEKLEADIEKAYRILRWKPKHSFEESLIKTIDWFYKNKNLYD